MESYKINYILLKIIEKFSYYLASFLAKEKSVGLLFSNAYLFNFYTIKIFKKLNKKLNKANKYRNK